jgi:hypothetical protein
MLSLKFGVIGTYISQNYVINYVFTIQKQAGNAQKRF